MGLPATVMCGAAIGANAALVLALPRKTPESRVSKDKVIPFRPRPPSAGERAVYEAITRKWQPELKQLMFPRHAQAPQDTAPPRRK